MFACVERLSGGRVKVLDHYYIELRDNSLVVVTGNYHYSTYIVGYVKYALSDKESYWRSSLGFYTRLVKQYTLKQVYESTNKRFYAPIYGAEVPVIPVSMVEKIYNPLERSESLYNSVNDDLEKVALEFLSEITISAGVSGKLGVTGSLLVGIHNPGVSDIDLVVYGVKESRDTVEFINENPSLFGGLRGERLREWCSKVSESTGLTVFEASKFYRRWRRGVYREREYSLIYNDGIYRYMESSERWRSVGVVEAIVTLQGNVEALNYPSIGFLESFEYIRGFKPFSEPLYVMSFEALYMPAFFEGGKCLIKGLLQVDERERTRILIGVKETDSFIKWLE